MSDMQMLVDRPNVQIHVREITTHAVCIKCKGSGVNYETIYHDIYVTRGLYWAGISHGCPQCYGKGFWERAEP